MSKSEYGDDRMLRRKLDQAIITIEDAFDTFPSKDTLIAWSGGKDSTLLLALITRVCKSRNIPLPRVLDIDQGDAFPEIISFRDKLTANWELDLVVVCNDDVRSKVSVIGDNLSVEELNTRNQEALTEVGWDGSSLSWNPASPIFNHLMKTVPVSDYISRHNVKAMYTGIRWDEQTARRRETYLSPRENPPHTRIHPLLHFTERDVWHATFLLDIPYNDLYRQGYRSIDTRTGTTKISDTPAWEQDLENTTERAGRGDEKEQMMEVLRALGYM